MNIIVLFDSMDSVPPGGDYPDDFGAEYDDEAAVGGIIEALRRGGHSARGLRLNEDFVANIRNAAPQLVFNIAEGVRGRGRESLAPAWLDHLGVPYTGSDAAALAVSLDKALTKLVATACGVRTPRFRVFGEDRTAGDIGDMEFPLFLKPVAEGSSMGIRSDSVVEDEDELFEKVDGIVARYRQGCLVEEFAPGREFCVGLLGNSSPRVLPIVEIGTSGGFYSYEQKSEHRKELVCPAAISRNIEREMVDMALTIYHAIGCRDLARADFRMDREGRPSFLEINPLPGLSEEYGIFPAQARAAGMNHDELINRIAELAIERGEP